jgi:hypothetical protein
VRIARRSRYSEVTTPSAPRGMCWCGLSPDRINGELPRRGETSPVSRRRSHRRGEIHQSVGSRMERAAAGRRRESGNRESPSSPIGQAHELRHGSIPLIYSTADPPPPSFRAIADREVARPLAGTEGRPDPALGSDRRLPRSTSRRPFARPSDSRSGHTSRRPGNPCRCLRLSVRPRDHRSPDRHSPGSKPWNPAHVSRLSGAGPRAKRRPVPDRVGC